MESSRRQLRNQNCCPKVPNFMGHPSSCSIPSQLLPQHLSKSLSRLQTLTCQQVTDLPPIGLKLNPQAALEQLRKAAAWQAGQVEPQASPVIAGESMERDSRQQNLSRLEEGEEEEGRGMLESVSVGMHSEEDKLGRGMFEEDRQECILHAPTFAWQSNNYLSPEAFLKHDPSELDS